MRGLMVELLLVTGIVCEINMDECETHPCQNGARCEDAINNYTCYCPPPVPEHLPWGGHNCDITLTGCVGEPCRNNAKCIPSFHENEHRFTCRCPAGFYGDTCDDITTFSISSYLVLEVPNGNRTRRHAGAQGPRIQLRFRTTLWDAVVFFRGNREHFFSLEVTAGDLVSRAESGDLKLAARISGDFSDGFWHEVLVSVDEKLILKAENRTTEDGGHNQLLAFQPHGLEKVYIGGVPQEVLNQTLTRMGFAGCFQDLLIDSHAVLPQNFTPESEAQMGCERTEWCRPNPCSDRGQCVDLWADYRCECRRPFYGHNCSEEHSSWTFSFERSRSFAAFPITQKHGSDVIVSFWLKTRHLNGLILQLRRQNRAYVTVLIKNGSIQVAVYASSRNASDVINIGKKVFVSIKKERGFIFLNKEQLFTPGDFVDFEVEAGDVAYLGGLYEGEDTARWGGYFKGCLQDVRIDDVQLYMYSGSISQKPQHPSYLPRNSSNLLEHCIGDQMCKMKPCQNGGKCIDTWNDFECLCPLKFSGKSCDTPVWCVSNPCVPGSRCVDLPDGYECLANATFQSNALKFSATGSLSISVTNISIDLRSREEQGTLLRASNGVEFFCMGLLNSSLIVKLRGSNTLETQAFLSNVPVSDGERHQIRLHASGSRWHLSVDGIAAGDIPATAGNLDFFNHSVLWLAENYTGCLGEVRIGGVYLPFFGNLQEEVPQTSRFVRIGGAAQPRLGCHGAASCLSEPCQNNGTCRDLFNLFHCDCAPGWTGNLCQDNIDECGQQPCEYGTCRDLPGDYECVCAPGYSGKSCQVEVDECQDHRCGNGSSCVDAVDGYTCVCPPGHSGPFCQWRFPPLQCDVDVMCENDGTCTDGFWGANCTCRPGFTGERCEEDIDECVSNPCLNGGTCGNRANSYFCECVPDFSGERCQNTKQLQNEGVPWLLVAVPLVFLGALLAAVALACMVLTARRKRRSEGTYSPSQQEVAGARLEMGSVLKVPPEERLI